MNEADDVVQISLKLPKTLNDDLLKKADLLNLNKSKVFRQALEAYIHKDAMTPMPDPLVVQVHFLAQLIETVDSLDFHRDLICQQVEVLECLIAEEDHSLSSDG